MKTLTNKQKLIDRITEIKLEKEEFYWKSKIEEEKNNFFNKVIKLKGIRKRIMNLHGSHFVPKRFPSAEYLSIKLSLEEFGIIL